MAILCMQKPVGHFIRAVLLMPLYVPLFSPKAYSSATASHVYLIVLKVRWPVLLEQILVLAS